MANAGKVVDARELVTNLGETWRKQIDQWMQAVVLSSFGESYSILS